MTALEGALLPAFALTLAGSVHCVSMCGGFVLALGARRGGWSFLADQVLLQIGKAASYLFLGALAGQLGAALLSSVALRWGSRALAVAAGLALIAAGWGLVGGHGGGGRLVGAFRPLLSPALSSLRATRPPGGSLVVGMLLGFLPCPLVYAGLVAAAATGRPALGALTLAGVAAGTVPALLTLALLGRTASAISRRRLAHVGAAVLIATGLVTLARGATSGHLHSSHSSHCPGAVLR